MEEIKRTAIVTGGAQGIGREIVKEYLEAGVKVCAFDLNAEQLDSLKAEFAAYGDDLITAAGNVTSYEDVEACVKKAAEAFGRIDILVNNAGGSFGVKGTPDLISLEDWDKVVKVNLYGQFYFVHAVTPYMKEQQYGRILCMSSKAGRSRGSGNSGTPYAAAKAGILGMVRTVSADVGPYGITINAIAPGAILSGERIKSFWNNRPQADIDEKLKSTPVRRFGENEDVASAVLFLTSERASFITGAVLDVNGGAWVG